MSDILKPKTGDIVLMVGTRKGTFLLSSGPGRKEWSLSGAHHAGSDVFHMAYDGRDGTVFAAINNPIFGPEIQRTNDLGATWTQASKNPAFASQGDGETSDDAVSRVWHIEPGRESEPGVVYAGVEPAALFKSEDGGDTWAEVDALTAHPSRPQWQPGFGGLCLHSMVLDPRSNDRMWVGISAVGTFGTDDGGASWTPMNSGVRADFLPDRFPEFGQCVHKMLSPKSKPDTIYQQNHCGVYRSDDGGARWTDLSEGLPSRWGMVLGLHSQDPKTIYTLPEDTAVGEDTGGGKRYVSDARFRVFRSRNGGDDWEPLTNGLPQKNAYIHCMREGMATDDLDECGIYVGTTTGQLFYSRDNGDSWELLIDYLPPISSVDCAMAL